MDIADREAKRGRMWMLSALRRCDLVDDRGQRTSLDDLTVDLLSGDYPPVARLIFRDANKQLMTLAWDAVVEIDWRHRRIRLTALDAAQDAKAAPRQEVLLIRDVLDALILDLQNRRVTRANDLCLEEGNGQLRLRAADVSLRAVLRRLSRGVFGDRSEGALVDWKYVEFLRGAPQAAACGASYYQRITRLPPAEIARLSEALPYLHAAELLTILPDPIAADVLEAMTDERELQVLEELSQDQALRLLELMAPDAAADLVGRLKTDAARSYLEKLSARQGGRIIELLRYPEDTVGGIMTNDVVFAAAALTVGEAREALRERLKEPDFIHFVYVVDDERSRLLRGVLSLRDLLVADEGVRLEEVMNPYLTTLGPLEPARAAADKVIGSHFAGLPVVGRDGRLLGLVTIDAAVAQAAPQSWSGQAPKVFS